MASPRNRRLFFIAVATLGLAAASFGTSSVGAVPAEDSAASEHRRVVDFWTAERRASAVPVHVQLPGPMAKPEGTPGGGNGNGGGGGGGDDGGGGETPAVPTGTVTGATWTYGGSVAETTGKVFFSKGSSTYVCSGSAVDSQHGSLVVTAGHCVHGGGAAGDFHQNWAFFPGYDGGPGALGTWSAQALFTTSGWAGSGDFSDDAGFAVVTDGTTTSLEHALAGIDATVPSIGFSKASYDGTYAAFGYPAAKKYKGTTLTWCQGSLFLDVDSNDSLTMACDMTGGSSGGPWFRDFDGTGDLHEINSVNSYGYSSLNGYMFGPIFDAGEQAAYDAATDGVCAGSEVCL